MAEPNSGPHPERPSSMPTRRSVEAPVTTQAPPSASEVGTRPRVGREQAESQREKGGRREAAIATAQERARSATIVEGVREVGSPAVAESPTPQSEGMKDYILSTVSGGGKLGVGSAVALGYLGYKSSSWAMRWSLIFIDGLARQLDKLADKMIDKKVPFFKYLFNPLVTFLDKSAKWLGIDKSLYEHLKKEREERKKLAMKLLKELRDEEKKYERKIDAAAKKKKRNKKIADALGSDVAALLIPEIEELEEEKEKPKEEKKEGKEAA